MTDHTPTSLYQYYDADDVLLYVGITGRGASRNAEHNQSKDWWQFVERQAVEHHPTRQSALSAERQLIRKFAPPFNTQHNPDHRAARDIYMIRRGFGGDDGVRMLNNARNRCAGVVVNRVGPRVTIAVPDSRVVFDPTRLTVESGGRKARALAGGTFADGSGSWVTIKSPKHAETISGAIVMYRRPNRFQWPAKLVQLSYGGVDLVALSDGVAG